jgi:serine/threonine protein kinase
VSTTASTGAGRRFHLKARIGSGAFGEVFLAEQDSGAGFRRDVALKVLHPEVAKHREASTRMRDEARILGRLSHRNIVKVLDLVQLGDRWAVVMDYLPGVDLEQVVLALDDRGERVPAPAALEATAAVCSALHAAYTADDGRGGLLSVVHRDIKPSNVRLTADGDVKVLDFGVARVENLDTREAKTRGAGWIGTERYMSPERILMEGDSSEGDVYAAFATLVELLLAKPLGRTPVLPDRHTPFVEEALTAVREHLHGPDEAVESLVDLMRRGLHADPEARPSADEARHALEGLCRKLEGDPLTTFARAVVPSVEATLGPPEAASGTLIVAGGSSGTVPAQVTNIDLLDPPPPPADPEATSAVRTPVIAAIGAAIGVVLVAAAIAALLGIVFVGWMYSPESAPTIGAGGPTIGVAPGTPGMVAPAPVRAPVPPPVVAEPAPAPVVAEPVPQPAVAEPAPAPAPAAASAPRPAPAPAAAPAVDPDAPIVSRAMFVLDNASALSAECSGVSGSGTASLRLRSFPAGACRVRATFVGQDYSTEVRVERPREVVCTVDGGALTCR